MIKWFAIYILRNSNSILIVDKFIVLIKNIYRFDKKVQLIS